MGEVDLQRPQALESLASTAAPSGKLEEQIAHMSETAQGISDGKKRVVTLFNLFSMVGTIIDAIAAQNGMIQIFSTKVLQPDINDTNKLSNLIAGLKFDSASDAKATSTNQQVEVELQVLLSRLKAAQSGGEMDTTTAGSLTSLLQQASSILQAILQAIQQAGSSVARSVGGS